MQRVFLIPGFFGFANFGDLKYFAHVQEVLSSAFHDCGQEVELHYVNTSPTASLPTRAAAIADALAAADDGRDLPIHLIGHSTGGLDARLFCSPGVTLPSAHNIDALAKQVRTVVSVATPHQGTPHASLFTSILGQRLLQVFSLLTLHGIRLGTMPLSAMVALAGTLPRTPRLQGPVLGILDQIYRQLIRDFDESRRAELEEFLSAAADDQALLPQLSIESMQVFNAAIATRATTRYGCVVIQGRPPSLSSMRSIGLSPTGQAMHALYRALYELGAGSPITADGLSGEQEGALTAAFGEMPEPSANDGIVPTLSQLFGEVVHATWADHHDVIGHFHGPDHDPPHVDWLKTQTHFTRSAFTRLWGDIASFACGTSTTSAVANKAN